MGSVKDLEILTTAQENKMGIGRFHFSDRYSVFDWGEMPDHIPHKGAALCILTAYFFELLEKEGIETHYRGIVENDQVKKLDELEKPASILEVDMVQVLEPQYKNGSYDYSLYKQKLDNCLIPLEIIYRNTLPKHSSFRRRAEQGEIDISDYGLDEMPEVGESLEKPIFDVSTKLESSDRYISWKEAKEIAGLSDKEYEKTINLLSKVNDIITKEVAKAGLKNLDGKIELAFDTQRNIMVVDDVGTPDECRFAYDGFSISKEAARKFYRNSQWYQEVSQAKKEEGPNWRDTVNTKPEKLPEEILNMVSNLYKACANEITGREWFPNTPSFEQLKK